MRAGDRAKGDGGSAPLLKAKARLRARFPPSDSPTLIDVPHDSNLHPCDAPTFRRLRCRTSSGGTSSQRRELSTM